MEQEIKLSFKLTAPPTAAQCGATTTTAYQQRNTIARVNSTLEIADCTAASGAFTVALRVKDESGEEKPLEFSETWQRSDDENVSIHGRLPDRRKHGARQRAPARPELHLRRSPEREHEGGGELAVAPEQPLTEN